VFADILPPEFCPSCNSILVWKNDLLYCYNGNCTAKTEKVVQHFAKTLKIKGLGPKSVEKLGLSRIDDIYNLRRDYTVLKLGSKLVASKLLLEIEKSKQAHLQELLPAFSIPLLGRTASDKLCNVLHHISEVDLKTCSKARLGPKVTYNLLHWYNTQYLNGYEFLPFSWNREVQHIQKQKGIVVISGKLNTFPTKAVAKAKLQKKGYIVKENLSKGTNFLVNESGITSSKTKKATEMGIKIITEINELIGDS
jgi:DNA ligase (NAD+)